MPQLDFTLVAESSGLTLACCLHLHPRAIGGFMHKRRVSVLYRENCGGILRNLAAGLRRTFNTMAELDLYDDLRERIFRDEKTNAAEQRHESAA